MGDIGSKYGKGHGAELRTERRKFAREEAGALAKSRMAEVERAQLGETRRERISEAGRMAGEAGLEKRHLREFGPEGTAAQKLSWAIGEGAKEEERAEFNRFAEGAFAKYAKREQTDTGELITTMPERIHTIRAEAMAMKPEEGRKYIGTAIKEYEGLETERKKLAKLTKPELEKMEAALEAAEVERTRLSMLTPEEIAAEEKTLLAKAGAKKRMATAKRLREEYEAENAPPSIFGRLSEAWRTRKPSPYIEPPSGLRGYR